MSSNSKLRKKQAKKNQALMRRLSSNGLLCHWCKQPVVIFRELPAESEPYLFGDYVVWKQDGHWVRERQATVDHVIPLRDGGARMDMDNVVISCPKCNRDRTPDIKQERPCKKCGVLVKGRKYCKPCGEEQYQVWKNSVNNSEKA